MNKYISGVIEEINPTPERRAARAQGDLNLAFESIEKTIKEADLFIVHLEEADEVLKEKLGRSPIGVSVEGLGLFDGQTVSLEGIISGIFDKIFDFIKGIFTGIWNMITRFFKFITGQSEQSEGRAKKTKEIVEEANGKIAEAAIKNIVNKNDGVDAAVKESTDEIIKRADAVIAEVDKLFEEEAKYEEKEKIKEKTREYLTKNGINPDSLAGQHFRNYVLKNYEKTGFDKLVSAFESSRDEVLKKCYKKAEEILLGKEIERYVAIYLEGGNLKELLPVTDDLVSITSRSSKELLDDIEKTLTNFSKNEFIDPKKQRNFYTDFIGSQKSNNSKLEKAADAIDKFMAKHGKKAEKTGNKDTRDKGTESVYLATSSIKSLRSFLHNREKPSKIDTRWAKIMEDLITSEVKSGKHKEHSPFEIDVIEKMQSLIDRASARVDMVDKKDIDKARYTMNIVTKASKLYAQYKLAETNSISVKDSVRDAEVNVWYYIATAIGSAAVFISAGLN